MAAATAMVDTRQKGWPQSPRALSGTLDRLAPALPHLGITLTRSEPDRNNTRFLTLTNLNVAAGAPNPA
jgi:hypothetical protein